MKNEQIFRGYYYTRLIDTCTIIGLELTPPRFKYYYNAYIAEFTVSGTSISSGLGGSLDLALERASREALFDLKEEGHPIYCGTFPLSPLSAESTSEGPERVYNHEAAEEATEEATEKATEKAKYKDEATELTTGGSYYNSGNQSSRPGGFKGAHDFVITQPSFYDKTVHVNFGNGYLLATGIVFGLVLNINTEQGSQTFSAPTVKPQQTIYIFMSEKDGRTTTIRIPIQTEGVEQAFCLHIKTTHSTDLPSNITSSRDPRFDTPAFHQDSSTYTILQYSATLSHSPLIFDTFVPLHSFPSF